MNADSLAAIKVIESDYMPVGFVLIRDSAGMAFMTPAGDLVRLPPFTVAGIGGNSLLTAGQSQKR